MRFFRAPNASEGSSQGANPSPSKSTRSTRQASPPNPQEPQPRSLSSGPLGALRICCLLCTLAACIAAQRTPPAVPTEPGPKLSPAEVVSAQLAALKNNDGDDTGIRITFRFASPGNKAQTGPLGRFIEMLKNPAYQPMINYKSDHREPIEIDGSVAKQVVALVSSSGKRTRYLFVLSKQEQPPCRGCWMTDAVMRLDPMSGPVRVASGAPRHGSAPPQTWRFTPRRGSGL